MVVAYRTGLVQARSMIGRRMSIGLLSMLPLLVGACGSDSAPQSPDDDTVTGNGAGTEPSNGGGGPSQSAPGSGAPQGPAVTIVRVHYPVGSHKLELVGDHAPLAWDKPTALTDVKNDTWELDFGKTDAPIAFKPTLDGKSARGPNYVVKPGQTLDVFPHFTIERGTVSFFQEGFASTNLGNTRDIRMYLPPSYEENTVARYPVVYMHDGQVLFTVNLTGKDSLGKGMNGSWDVDKTFDEGIESGALPEAIVIGIDVVADLGPNPLGFMDTRNSELTPTTDDDGGIKNSGKGPQYLKMVTDEIKPLVDGKLRTLPERSNTYMAGSSLGGLMSSWAGIERGDLFVGIASLSGSNFWDDEVIVKKAKEAKAGLPHADRVYADVGEKEGGGDSKMTNAWKNLVAAYAEAGYVEGKTLMKVLDPEGKHHGDSWSKRFPAALAFLLGPGR